MQADATYKKNSDQYEELKEDKQKEKIGGDLKRKTRACSKLNI